MIETEDIVGASVGSGLRITRSKDELVQALGDVYEFRWVHGPNSSLRGRAF